jgi:hypothetical protein
MSTRKALPWVFDDGGRADSGRRGTAGDCVVRAWAIALQRPYDEVYTEIAALMKERARHLSGAARARADHHTQTPRDGVPTSVIHRFARDNGFAWVPTMSIGSGTTHHLAVGELPDGRIVARASKHVTAVVDGTIRDNHDPSRGGTRAVYGYWHQPSSR